MAIVNPCRRATRIAHEGQSTDAVCSLIILKDCGRAVGERLFHDAVQRVVGVSCRLAARVRRGRDVPRHVIDCRRDAGVRTRNRRDIIETIVRVFGDETDWVRHCGDTAVEIVAEARAAAVRSRRLDQAIQRIESAVNRRTGGFTNVRDVVVLLSYE